MSAVKLLVLAGSPREGSFNQRLADTAATMAQAQGAEVTAIRIDSFGLPMYTPHLEATAFPEGARRLKSLFAQHHGVLMAAPEYNGSIPAYLKNAIDWVSRPTDGEGPLGLSAFRGKVAGLMSASPGPFGGLRSLAHLRQILSTVQMLVVPEQATVPFADRAFNEAELIDPVAKQVLPVLVKRVIDVAGAIR